jgi:hypothetical protein
MLTFSQEHALIVKFHDVKEDTPNIRPLPKCKAKIRHTKVTQKQQMSTFELKIKVKNIEPLGAFLLNLFLGTMFYPPFLILYTTLLMETLQSNLIFLILRNTLQNPSNYNPPKVHEHAYSLL